MIYYETYLGELPVTVEYEYTPAEGDGFHSPYINEDVDLYTVRVGDHDITLFLDDEVIRNLEIEILGSFYE